MRLMEDPFMREQLLILLRQGNSLSESCKALNISPQTLRTEREIDITFSEQIVQAQGSAFSPVMHRLIEQATHGDTDDAATLKSWELVVRHYDKALDRDHDHDKISHVAERQAAMDRPKVPGLTNPDQVAELLAAIKEQNSETIDVGEAEAGTGSEGLPLRDEAELPEDEDPTGL